MTSSRHPRADGLLQANDGRLSVLLQQQQELSIATQSEEQEEESQMKVDGKHPGDTGRCLVDLRQHDQDQKPSSTRNGDKTSFTSPS